MIPPTFVPTLRSTTSPEMSFSYDSSPELPFPQTSTSSSSYSHMSVGAGAPLAYQMYERLRRMSDERKLNLSEEDVLISAYLGPNLVYRTAEAAAAAAKTTPVDHTTVLGSLHVDTV